MIKNALLICESKSDNLGDQAISDAMIIGLKAEGYEVETADFSCRKSFSNQERISFLVKVFNKFAPQVIQGTFWFFKNFLYIRKISNKNHEIVIIGGGQLMHSNINFPFAFFSWSFFNRRKKVYVFGCGCDKQFRSHEIFLFQRALKYIKKGFLRDFDSIKNAKNFFKYDFSFTPDVAYLLGQEIVKNQKALANKNIGISVIDYRVYRRYADEVGNKILTKEEYIDFWSKEIIYLSANYECIYFLSTTSTDHQLSLQVKRKLELLKINKKIEIFSTHSWSSLIEQLKGVSLYHTGRMHGLILAKIANIEISPFVVSNKIRVFNEELKNLYLNDAIKKIKISLKDICDGK